MKCPKCEGKDTVKTGKSSTGKQRYWCPACQKSFQDAPHTSRTKSKLTDEEIGKLREQGMTYQDIGDIANLTRERVRQILNMIANNKKT